ncbi:ComEA family DNA-binding protein [Candidatus Woesebacteria bacterium]|nr:ComEA family DNA-binding protein [Candidatus Woesebacteria bacterium]
MDDLPEDGSNPTDKLHSFGLENSFYKYRFFLLSVLVALILVALGTIYLKGGIDLNSTKIEVIEPPTEPQRSASIVVEISGAVEKPGVYKLPANSRVEDALIAAGGLSALADRAWVDKSINRAAKITDGQKIYIAIITSKQSSAVNATNRVGHQNTSMVLGAESSGLVNINTASAKDLDLLPGIGPTYAQRIIENRPYSEISELVSKKILSKSTFEKIKDKISLY